MLRADMDALNIKEETGLAFSSKYEDRMHACGHDLHTAMLLGTAKILVKHKDELNGNVRLLFQTGEEFGDGAKYLLENNALDNVDMGFGIHCDPLAKVGKLSSRIGPIWAAVDRFIITVKGKSGHGATPDKCHDATIAASSIAMNLQTMVSRRCDPLKSLVVTIGKLHSGTAFNIISGEAVLEGTCRSFDEDIYEMIPDALSEISTNIAKGLGCEADVEVIRSCKPLVNSEEAFNILKISADKILDNKEDFFICEKAMIGEDFSEYANIIPCVFAMLGTDAGYPLHNCHIDFKEEAIEYGMAIEVQFVLDALNSI